MKRPYYIFSPGRIRRQQNTIFFEKSVNIENDETGEDEAILDQILVDRDFTPEKDAKGRVVRRVIPIEDIESLYCFGEMTLNTKLITFLSKNHITAHFFNYYGFYSSSLVPRDYLVSGDVVLRQAENCLDMGKRLDIAKEFIGAAADNILNNLHYYQNRGKETQPCIDVIEKERVNIHEASDISRIMAAEGRMRNMYYKFWDLIIDPEFDFDKRTRRPPENAINALLSFGNTMLYTTVLGELFHTQIHPALSFLHEPGARRFSLCLDIAEVFKPFIVDRLIFSLLNKKQINKKMFDEKLNFCYLKEEGRKIFVKAYDERMKTTVKHRNLGRNVSYRRLIRLEAYKLIKHVSGIKKYKAFRMWW